MKPMLAAREVKDEDIRFPIYASPKLDGIRGLTFGDRLMSRKLKAIPNEYCQELFSHQSLRGMDGELILGSPTASDVYHKTHSAVMRKSGTPDVDFYVFDMYTLGDLTFERRLMEAEYRIQRSGFKNVFIHQHQIINNLNELKSYEDHCISQGFEGVITRQPHGPYKFGRSTPREQFMVKIKRFVDSEAEILDVVELLSNQNEQKMNEVGSMRRSSHKANMVPMGTMGTLKVRDIHTGVEFYVGSGFTDAVRKTLWRKRKTLPGQIIKYKYFPVGVKDLPRHPVFLGFRSKIDL